MNRQYVKDAHEAIESPNYYNLKSLDQALDSRVNDAQNDQFTCKNIYICYISLLQKHQHSPIDPESISNYRSTAESCQERNRVSQICSCNNAISCETVDDVKEDNSYSNNESQVLQKISESSQLLEKSRRDK